MGHHIDKDGNFQSDLNPELPPNKITLSFKDEHARKALWVYAHATDDKELAVDIATVLIDKFGETDPSEAYFHDQGT